MNLVEVPREQIPCRDPILLLSRTKQMGIFIFLVDGLRDHLRDTEQICTYNMQY